MHGFNITCNELGSTNCEDDHKNTLQCVAGSIATNAFVVLSVYSIINIRFAVPTDIVSVQPL